MQSILILSTILIGAFGPLFVIAADVLLGVTVLLEQLSGSKKSNRICLFVFSGTVFSVVLVLASYYLIAHEHWLDMTGLHLRGLMMTFFSFLFSTLNGASRALFLSSIAAVPLMRLLYLFNRPSSERPLLQIFLTLPLAIFAIILALCWSHYPVYERPM